MSLVYNERIKLSATYLNGMAIAIFAVGGFAPLIASFAADDGFTARKTILAFTCLVASGTIHFLARMSLKGLRS